LFRLISCLFRFNRNTETRCFGIEAKQPKQTFCFGETSFGSSFGCFESKLVSKDTLCVGLFYCKILYKITPASDNAA
jgi:hypothetical protein